MMLKNVSNKYPVCDTKCVARKKATLFRQHFCCTKTVARKKATGIAQQNETEIDIIWFPKSDKLLELFRF